jgi:hypothetical protein
MQKLLILSVVIFSLLSCSKSSDGGGSSTGPDYSGNYKGTITVTTNGAVTQTLSDYTIGVVHIANTMTLSNNVHTASNGIVTNGVLTLDKKFVALTPSTNLENYGAASFSSTAMIISFKQDERDFNTNAVLNTKTWTGTLTKQ